MNIIKMHRETQSKTPRQEQENKGQGVVEENKKTEPRDEYTSIEDHNKTEDYNQMGTREPKEKVPKPENHEQPAQMKITNKCREPEPRTA